MEQNKRVTVIDAIDRSILYGPEQEAPKRKVAAYARVSTEQDEQENSYEAQVNFYTKYIRNNPEWEFAGIYADKGITGTNTKNRDGFNQMVADAMAGKINLILTKSLSRFSRNVVDAVKTIRELRLVGCEIMFEKENINSMDPKSDTLLTIMANMAEEESRSISENVKWGQRRSMQSGNVAMAYGRFLGYRKGADGKPEIVPEEAELVQDIYRMFLDGMTISNIAKTLTERKIPTPAKKEKWQTTTVRSILSNEKYKGDALRQKTYTVDYLTKTVRKNNGELKQYYITNSHPAIIDEDTFELVQLELAKRSQNKGRLSNNSPFTMKIVCSDCGSYFGHKVFHGKEEKYRKDVWYCNHRYDGEEPCSTPIIPEADLKNAYLSALGQILARKAACLAECRAKLEESGNLAEVKKNRQNAEERLQALLQDIQELVHDNARRTQDQTKYRAKYTKLYGAIESQKELVASLKSQELNAIAGREILRRFIKAIETCDDSGFQPAVWNDTVERAVVSDDRGICFEFKNGEKVTVKI